MRWLRLRGVLIVFALTGFLGVRDSGAKQSLFAPAPGSPVAVASGPGDVALVDINQDGNLDLLVAIDQEPSIGILPGQGDGTFQTATQKLVLLPNPPSDVVVGDLNGDNLPDLAISSHDSYGIMLALGDSSGGFSLASNSPVIMNQGHHPHTHGLAMGDLNGDNHRDLIATNHEDNAIAVALNDGQAEFTLASGTPFEVGPLPYPFALDDVNKDSHLDIIATSTAQSSSIITILLGDGRAGFQESTVTLRTARPWFATTGDVNGDDNPDLVTTHWERNEATVMLGDGDGNFSEVDASPFDLGQKAFQITIADVNDDYKADLIAAAGNEILVMLGNGEGYFEPAPGSPFTTENGSWRFALADVNGDGRLDVITGNQEGDSVSILLAQPPG